VNGNYGRKKKKRLIGYPLSQRARAEKNRGRRREFCKEYILRRDIAKNEKKGGGEGRG